MHTETIIREFIKNNFIFSEDTSDLDGTASLLESGIIDSTGVLEIVQFLEERFGIAVEDEELVPQNLDSIKNLTCFVHRKLNVDPDELQSP